MFRTDLVGLSAKAKNIEGVHKRNFCYRKLIYRGVSSDFIEKEKTCNLASVVDRSESP